MKCAAISAILIIVLAQYASDNCNGRGHGRRECPTSNITHLL